MYKPKAPGTPAAIRKRNAPKKGTVEQHAKDEARSEPHRLRRIRYKARHVVTRERKDVDTGRDGSLVDVSTQHDDACRLPLGEGEGRERQGYMEEPPESKQRAKRIYRRASELPDPTQSPAAPINRTKKQVPLRLPEVLIDKVDQAAQAEGKTRNQWIEETLELRLDR